MADRAQGAISFQPIVTIAADADADAVDAIHHNIKKSLGGDLTFTVQDGDDNWFYAPNVIATTTSEELFGASDDNTDLVGASGDQSNGPNEAVGNAVTFTDDSTADCSADKVWFLFIKNTGTSDTSSTSTTNSVYVSLDGTAAAHNALDNIEIKAGEAWMGNIAGPLMQSIFIITGQARGAGTGTGSVRCTVAAIVEDVA
jgi:archaellum component FlaG (FlaF/FlaG flagellin family)